MQHALLLLLLLLLLPSVWLAIAVLLLRTLERR
jgi:hypothetical protein